MVTLETNSHPQPRQTDDSIRIQDLLYLFLSRWYWFVLSLLVTLGIACLYLLRTPNVYTQSASILIKEGSKGKSMSSDVESFGDFGLFQTNTNVNNELIALQSPSVMSEVVKRLHLETDYFTDGRFHRETAYGSSLPVTVSMPDFPENESAAFTLQLFENGAVILSDFKRNGETVETEPIRGVLQDTLTTPLGKVIVMPTPYYQQETVATLYVNRSSLYNATIRYTANLTVLQKDEKSSIINLSVNDVSIQRADDILNQLITVYNEHWVRDKNQVAISTSMFINERLGVIEQELGSVDKSISSYKSEHLLPDVQAASTMYMAQSSEANAQLLALNNQLYMVRYIRNYLTDESKRNQLLPANSGIESSNIESQISEYNTKLLQRNSLAANSSTQNPLVMDLDRELIAMREAIITSIDNQLVTLNTQIKNLQQNERQTTARIAASPNQAQYLLSVERQQKVKEALYLFLLQKREENELSQAFTAYNTRIITPPGGMMRPTSPDKKNILLIALALGLIIPAGILFMRESMNTKVRGRKDLEIVSLPFVGEIPLVPTNNKKKGLIESKSIVMRQGARDIINEAFRVLRTNLEFMATPEEGKGCVLLLTSFNPGSGKSFLTMNLAASLALKGKKILIIDSDLRHGSASSYVDSPERGISDYLGKRTDSVENWILGIPHHPNLYVLPVGTPPPNPTELLSEPRFENLVNKLRSEYDYIFIDCPPIDIVADTQIIEKSADRTLFVIRAGLLERDMLPELQKLYEEKRFKNMAVILNGTVSSGSRYGYKYGYKYGYHYGYGSKSYYDNKNEG